MATAPTPLSDTAETVVRSSEYSIAAAQMAVAISSLPAGRRNNWWLLAMGAPIASAAVREALRPRLLRADSANPWALLAPSLVGLAGAGVLLMTQYRASPRYRYRGRGCP